MMRFPTVTTILLFLLFCCISASGQFEKITTITLEDTIAYATVDRPGDVYLVFSNGKITRMNKDGAIQGTAHFKNFPVIFEPRDGARLFAYFSDHHYTFLPPSFSPVNPPQPVDPAFAINPYLVCSSGDYNLVVLDSADWSLKKINLQTNVLLFETALPDSLHARARFRYMRDYQNFIFLLDSASGIRIFNPIGRLVKTLPVRDLHQFNFLGEELYYAQHKTLILFNLFSARNRQLELPHPAEQVLLTDERLFTISGNTVTIFAVKP